ncbi:MAG: hypothetical protein HKL80_05920 [Acidimicrobiales bacterium]|nr:hypothetical protein [Acidimicrobiales bacterium]
MSKIGYYGPGFGYSTAAQSNLGDAIIVAGAVYVHLGHTYGKSTSETVKEMQKGAIIISYVTNTAKAANVVGVTDLKCRHVQGCQEVELVSIDLRDSLCYYVRVNKTVTLPTTSSNGVNSSSQTAVYGSRLLKSGEDQCSTSDKVSNWKVGSFPWP